MMCARPYMRNPVPDRIPYNDRGRLDSTPMPCGQCLPCRVNKARQWVTRIMLEAAATEASCFCTLTYNNDFMPKGDIANGERVGRCCLDKKELQNFFKRLRKNIAPLTCRYFAIGEYGDISLRPHYHCIIFGLGRDDGPILSKAWSDRGVPIGLIDVGDVTNHSARYITNYAMKNLRDMNDPFVAENYPLLKNRTPEFMLSSKGGKKKEGGIGITGIRKIAEQWNKSNVTDKRICREFSLFGKEVPLGRYLTQKFAEFIGVEEEDFEQELYQYQNELFENFIKKGTVYYDNLTNFWENKRLVQKKKIQIFRQRRSI